MPRTIFYLGGDSYPGEQDWEDALGDLLNSGETRFVRHLEFHRPWDLSTLPSITERLDMIAEAVGRAGAGDEIFLIGRSAGARVATLFAAQNPRIQAVVCLFYPFRMPGRRLEPERFTHLATIRTPTLIWQGANDEYGGAELTEDYELSEAIRLRFVPGEHGLRTNNPSGRHILGDIPGYIESGWNDPGWNLATFDEHFYLWTYPGIADAVAKGICPSGAQHFQAAGRREGKKYRMRVEMV
jgi:hypothetical protein